MKFEKEIEVEKEKLSVYIVSTEDFKKIME